MKHRRRIRGGFSLVEVLLVITIAGILFAIAAPMRSKAAQQARDAVARANIRNVLFAELAHYAESDSFTSSHAVLRAFEPNLQLYEDSDSPPGSVYLVLGQSTTAPALCLFAQGTEGAWQTLYYSNASGGAVGLPSPEECTRRMLDEETGQNPPHAPNWREHIKPPLDTIGAAAIVR
jgi:prepilin-type N-terminal cleavage/methylation domain-containing protein